ncbi:MAG: hypothetical protein ACFFDV_12380 [Candidatus Thorarchaeota archaeon]
MSEYVEVLILLLKASAITGNIVLFYLVVFCVDEKVLVTQTSFIENTQQNQNIGKKQYVARWMLIRPRNAIIVFIVWMLSFIGLPIIVPIEYRIELFNAILGNIFGIPLPFAPIYIAMRSMSIHRQRRIMMSQ